jgi:hypothetical protein
MYSLHLSILLFQKIQGCKAYLTLLYHRRSSYILTCTINVINRKINYRQYITVVFSTIYLSIYLSTYLWLYSPCEPLPLFQFHNLYKVGGTPWTVDQPVARPLPTHRTTQTQNKRTQTSMPRVGFEPTIPVFERAKTVHALECLATEIGNVQHCIPKFHIGLQ